MKRFNKAAPILLLSCVALFSCVDEPVQIEEENLVYQIPQTNKVLTRSTSLETYETLPNPYALDVMQQVYDIYSESPVTLQPTDLYVKFMPKDSLELHTLKYDCDLELFDYPLDIELAEGEEYINYDLPETDLVWLYTTVSPDYVFPQGISYEILEECYIPEDGETVGIPTKAGEVNVEDAAFALVGYDEIPSIDTRSVVRPSGTFTVEDNTYNLSVPLKGVKVRCHRLVKWAKAYTDENGKYSVDKSFRYKPYYEIVFDNVKGFDVWRFGGGIGCAKHPLHKREREGYTCEITTDSISWEWAVINNSAYEYYQMCETGGIAKPPIDLKILNFRYGSSAPMIRRIQKPNERELIDFYVNKYIYENFGIDINLDVSLIHETINSVLPDITINTSGLSYAGIYNVVNHELAHASHFSVVGTSYWTRYVNHIIQNGGYGNGAGIDSQLCAVGEMWGYYMGYARTKRRYPSIERGVKSVDEWIYPQKFWTIDSLDILLPFQIFDCLSPEVDTYDELVDRIYTLYPDKVLQIEAILNDHPPLNHSVRVPGYDTVISNIVYSCPFDIKGDRIAIQNASVSNGATLTIEAETSVTIIGPFVVEKEASLTINLGNYE